MLLQWAPLHLGLGGRSAVIDRRYRGECFFAYFFFDFLVLDFLLPPESGFDFADFEAEDFLAPLPFWIDRFWVSAWPSFAKQAGLRDANIKKISQFHRCL